MSEPAANARRKVSREGVVLLKSFEGFRARAERDGDGWVIGYGHRKSAREGLTVALIVRVRSPRFTPAVP